MSGSPDKASLLRTLLAGLAGGLALNLMMLLTFRLIGFGWNGDGFLLNPAIQSRKLIAVWTRLEPLPLVVANPLPIVVGLVLFGVLHAFIYRSVAPAWKRGLWARGTRFSLLIFVMGFLFWEFFTPFNQFGEPVWLIGVELVFWGTIALAEGLVISAIIEHLPPWGGDRP
jgi:hypothetical protein